MQSEDVQAMIQVKAIMDSCPLTEGNVKNEDETSNMGPKNFRRYLRAVAFRKIMKDVNGYLFIHCQHNFVEDLIDIDPDRSRTIRYCDKCMLEHHK